jgi:hypothetical protein
MPVITRKGVVVSDSHSATRELAFRAKLLTGLAGLGGLGGGVLYLSWASGWRELTFEQYLHVLHRIFSSGELAFVRTELLLSMLAGAVLLTLPALVFYVRRALAAAGK